jgi:hypothetical protein
LLRAEIAVGKPPGTKIDIAGLGAIRMDGLVRQYLAEGWSEGAV